MYAKVENGVVTQVGLPTSSYLSDGNSVSNYNLLPESVLLEEGWLPYTEDIPTYNENTHILQISSYEILVNEVIGHFEAVLRTPTEDEIQDATIGEILEVIIPSLL